MLTKEEAQKAYDDLIQLRRKKVLVKSKENLGRIEVHHIVPVSIGGLDDEINKISLLAKEHFMAHVYLFVIHHDDEFHDQMTCALLNMHKGTVNGYRKELRDFILMSDEYQLAREEFAKLASKILSKANKGEKNHCFGKHWYKDPNSINCGMFFEDEQPDGWVRGKYLTDKEKQYAGKSCKGKIWIYNSITNENKIISKDDAEILISSGEWYYGHVQKTMSKQGKANIRNAHLNISISDKFKYSMQGKKSYIRGKKRYINLKTNEIHYFGKDELIPENYVLTSSLNKKRLKPVKSLEVKHQKWLEETQEMVDYFSLYGYEETCKKFNVNMSQESMIMRFVRARKIYGIKFKSQPGKKRVFKIPS